MATWPWPLDGVQKWFEDLWNWVSTAAVNAVKVVNDWIKTAMTGLSKVFTDWFDKIWDWIQASFVWVGDKIVSVVTDALASIGDAFGTLWTQTSGFLTTMWGSIGDAFGTLWTQTSAFLTGMWGSIGDAFGTLWTNISDFFSNLWTSISNGLSGVWASVSGAVSGLWDAIHTSFGDLWGNVSGFLTRFWNDVSGSIVAIGTVVTGAVSGFNDLVGGLLTGFATAMGTALQQAVTGVTNGLKTAIPAVLKIVDKDFIQPLAGALRWVENFVSDLFGGFYDSVVNTLRGVGMGTPEGAVVLSVPLMLASLSAIFVMGVLGAVGDIQIVGCGIRLSSLTNQLIAAFGITALSSAVISPILGAAYGQPVKYYWDSVFRPAIVSTGQADQMFFEQNIGEAEWHQVYAYHGWKEADISAWAKTMWREPSVLVLRAMSADPGADMVWVRKKLRENGLIGEDADAIIAYGARAAVKDERTSLATQLEKDFVDGVVDEAEYRGDLAALKFNVAEIDFRVAKAQFLVSRAERAAAVKAAQLPVTKKKGMTESDLEKEVTYGLISHATFIADMDPLQYPADVAERKYRLLITPKPVTAAEVERRNQVIQAQINRAEQRYDIALARQDLNLAYYVDALEYLQTDTSLAQRSAVVQGQINKAEERYKLALARQDLNLAYYGELADYLSGLEKPPEDRIVTLQLQIEKAQGERALIEGQRDAELAALNAELEGPFKPPGARIQRLQEQITKAAGEKQLIIQQRDAELADLNAQLSVVGAA